MRFHIKPLKNLHIDAVANHGLLHLHRVYPTGIRSRAPLGVARRRRDMLAADGQTYAY